MPIQWLDIARGINQENNAVPTRIRFTVSHLNQENGYYVIQLSETGIKDDGGRQTLHSSFEGAKVWWPSIQDQLGGAGRILRVDTDTSKIMKISPASACKIPCAEYLRTISPCGVEWVRMKFASYLMGETG